uniref:C2 domain-containing protein n=1 Tax=Musa acuminata subsp. malaccensis TaxID=214687 RepID=A0A804KT37_MUSAM|nr:PREDICTED: elicitor-responsive protein 1-like isoform X1 [Musa acuminata subsp. malaccensis]
MAKGILEVQLIDAKGLKDTDLIGKIDPYVVIQYRGQERKSKTARDSGGAGQGSNPSWNETFKFLVNSAAAGNHQQHKITMRVMDHDTFTSDDFLGESTIHVGDLITQGMENGTGELRPTKYSVVLSDRSYCGEIRVGVTFTAKMEEENTEEFGGWSHSFHA